MKILIATPLYPPDIAGHAPYVKEFAKRLSGSHEVTILTYNHIPERVPGVHIITVPKRLPSLIRMFKFTRALMKAERSADVVFFQNGPSVEVPLILASLTKHPPYIFRLGDETPIMLAANNSFYRHVLLSAIARSQMVMTHGSGSVPSFMSTIDDEKLWECPRPLMRPEILPFQPHPQAALDAYEASWREHVHGFLNIMATILI